MRISPQAANFYLFSYQPSTVLKGLQKNQSDLLDELKKKDTTADRKKQIGSELKENNSSLNAALYAKVTADLENPQKKYGITNDSEDNMFTLLTKYNSFQKGYGKSGNTTQNDLKFLSNILRQSINLTI